MTANAKGFFMQIFLLDVVKVSMKDRSCGLLATVSGDHIDQNLLHIFMSYKSFTPVFHTLGITLNIYPMHKICLICMSKWLRYIH